MVSGSGSGYGSGSGSGDEGENPPYGGGGSNSWPQTIFIESDDPIISDILEYLECFDTDASVTITIYVEQPTPNEADTWSGPFWDPDPGHTFFSIEQGEQRRILGYYPAEGVNPASSSPTATGIFRDNGGHAYDVKVAISNVPPTEVANVLDYIENYPTTYNLETTNCTDVALRVATEAGHALPDNVGSWPGGTGSNPGTLGQDIRTLSNGTNLTVTTTGGTAPFNSGTCP